MKMIVSYHGKEHYNSVVPTKFDVKIWKNYKDNILTKNPGEYEDEILNMKKERSKYSIRRKF